MSCASGWHLHQSLVDARAATTCSCASDDGELLSPFGRGYLAGLLAHARASAVFSTPTINGYKRYRPYSLAPDRAIWGRDNRGVDDPRARRPGRPGDAAREPHRRAGGKSLSLHGLADPLPASTASTAALDPGPSADTPYETKAALLPKSLREAVAALQNDPFFREALGAEFVDYYVHIKKAEIERFQAEVSRMGAARIFRDVLRPRRASEKAVLRQWW